MNELEKIEININNLNDNISFTIDNRDKSVIIGNNKKAIEQSQIDNLLRIIRNWDEAYLTSNNIDDEKYILNFCTKNNRFTFTGNASLSANYHDFKNWIGDIYD